MNINWGGRIINETTGGCKRETYVWWWADEDGKVCQMVTFTYRHGRTVRVIRHHCTSISRPTTAERTRSKITKTKNSSDEKCTLYKNNQFGVYCLAFIFILFWHARITVRHRTTKRESNRKIGSETGNRHADEPRLHGRRLGAEFGGDGKNGKNVEDQLFEWPF